MSSPDEAEMSEVKIEIDVAEDPGLLWSTQDESPGVPCDSTVQPMSGNTSGSLLSLKRGRVCQRCSAAFVLVSSLELHLASVHGEPLPFPEWTENSDGQMSLPHERLSTEETDHVRQYSTDSAVDFAVKQEPAWSMEEDSPDQPSAVYSTVQPMSDNTSGSLLSLKRGRVCQHCSAAFVLFSSLELHLVSVHGEKLLMVLPGSSTPDRCDAGNCSNTDMDKGIDSSGKGKMMANKVHDNDTGDKDGKKRIAHNECDVCKKSFFDSSTLRRHKRIHSGVKAFVCDVCSKCFTRADDLTKHKRTHTVERPYKCPLCDRDFKQSSSLQCHLKSVHGGAKSCDICGAAFSMARDLARHMRIHKGKKPHMCSDCGKCLADSSSLRKHSLTHTGLKPHVCSDCGKRFAYPSVRRRHRLTHTELKPHVCSDCGKRFADPSARRRHRLTHSDEKPHSCPHCPAAFKYSVQLKRHIQSKQQ